MIYYSNIIEKMNVLTDTSDMLIYRNILMNKQLE